MRDSIVSPRSLQNSIAILLAIAATNSSAFCQALDKQILTVDSLIAAPSAIDLVGSTRPTQSPARFVWSLPAFAHQRAEPLTAEDLLTPYEKPIPFDVTLNAPDPIPASVDHPRQIIDLLEQASGEDAIREVLRQNSVDVNHLDPRITAVDGMKSDTLLSVILLAEAFHAVAPNARLMLTGGCEWSHAENWSDPNRHSHGTGYKYDLGLNSNDPALSAFVKEGRTPAPSPDGRPGYNTPWGWFVYEGNPPHWDVRVETTPTAN